MAHTFACLRITEAISDAGARLATGSGGLTLGRAGFAPTGRHTKFHEGIASSSPNWPALPGRTDFPILPPGAGAAAPPLHPPPAVLYLAPHQARRLGLLWRWSWGV